jgi:hypothetical protein
LGFGALVWLAALATEGPTLGAALSPALGDGEGAGAQLAVGAKGAPQDGPNGVKKPAW